MLVLKAYIFNLLIWTLEVYRWVVIVYCIAGFFITNRYAPWFVFLRELVEPPLDFFRRLSRGRLVIENFDLSPILLFFGIYLIQMLITYVYHL